jgi:uncharacterized protein
MKCPKCSDSQLKPQVLRGVEVDRCGDCGGVWFDENELAKLLADGGGGNALRGSDSGMNRQPGECPRDGTKLLRVFSKQNRSVVIDRCPTCKGIWLDAGEFQRVSQS